jgi:hypothetical protein
MEPAVNREDKQVVASLEKLVGIGLVAARLDQLGDANNPMVNMGLISDNTRFLD